MADGPFFSSMAELAGGGGIGTTTHDFIFKFDPEWGVDQESNILATVAEVDKAGHVYIGDAQISVLSIAPNHNGCIVRIASNWYIPLMIRVALVIWP